MLNSTIRADVGLRPKTTEESALVEAERLKILWALDILDTGPEEAFDALARAASLACETPIALITLVDAKRQWFKANIGMPGVRETSRDIAFCAHAIGQKEILEIPDASLDPRFARNPLVTGEPNICFYAGAPLESQGERIGTLCVIDREPRRLTCKQRDILRCLATAAVQTIENRRKAARTMEKAALRDLSDFDDASLAAIRIAWFGSSVANAIPAKVAYWDKNLICQFANNGDLGWFGKRAEDIIGKPMLELLGPKLFEQNRPYVMGALAGAEQRFERTIVKADGTEGHFLANYVPDISPRGHVLGFFVLSVDVTPFKEMTRRLEASETRLRAFSDNSPVGVFYTANDGLLTYVSERWKTIFGLQAGQNADDHWTTLIAAPDHEMLANRWIAMITGGTSELSVEAKIQAAAGQERQIRVLARPVREAGGELLGFVGSVEDVTREKAIMLRLIESEALQRRLVERNEVYRAIIESLPDNINAKDREGRFIAVNPATVRFLNVGSPEDLVGKSDFDFYPRETARAFQAQEAIVLTNTVLGPFEEEIERPDGRKRWLETLKTPLLDSEGEVIGVITHNKDISEQKRLEIELKKTDAVLTAAVTRMADGLVMFDSEGVISFCNQRYRDMFPLTSDLRTPGARLPDILRASVARGEEEPKADIEAWIAERVAALGRTEDRSFQCCDGRVIEARMRPAGPGETLITFSDVSVLRDSEAAAREANRMLVIAEEIAQLGHWRLDISTNKVTWSDEIFRIHGLQPAKEAPTVEAAVAFYHRDDRAEIERCVAEAITRRKNFEFKARLLPHGGGIRHVLCRGVCEVDPVTGKTIGLFGVYLDLTEAAETQRALAERTSDLEATLDNMNKGLVKISASRRIDLANRRFFELLDLPRDVVARANGSFSVLEAYIEERGDQLKPQTLEIPDSSEGTTDWLLECRDGRVLEVRSRPLPGGAELWLYSDLTARIRAEKAIQDSEARYRMLTEVTSDTITQINLDLTRRYASPACRALLGYEPEEMVALPPGAIIHPEDFPDVERTMRALIAQSVARDRVTVTYRIRHKAGHFVSVETAISLVRDPATRAPESLLLSLRDVSERARAARHLERAKAEAEKVARLKSEFLANMSHELRTPLTGILGLHDLLARDPSLRPEQKRHVDMAREAGRALLGIVNDILDFSKIEAGQFTIEMAPFKLADVVETCRALGQQEARPKMLAVAADLAGVPAMLVGDATRLRQVLLNLVTNAVKFTDRGGVLIQATYDEGAGRLRVEVIDSGIGIPDDKLPVLFERFSQADASVTRRFGGTGLGLAISKRLVGLMGGEIGVKSEPARGSTFWFELPLTVSRRDFEPRAIETRAAQSPVRGMRLLLAEDNRVNREIIKKMLEQYGHAVTAVENGLEAIEELRRAPGFDAVLMDLQMPVMDGLTATAHIRDSERKAGRPAIPIVGLTANAMVEDVQRCIAGGMQAHVAKPIEWEVLLAAIQRVTARAAPAPTGEIVDGATLAELAGVLGKPEFAELLDVFASELEALTAELDEIGDVQLTKRAHKIKSSAGQLGFKELLRLCVTVEEDARKGAGRSNIDAFAAALRRAAGAARSSAASLRPASPAGVRLECGAGDSNSIGRDVMRRPAFSEAL